MLPSWRWPIIALAAVAVIAADQVTKWWARNKLDSPMDLIGSLRFNLTSNSGMAFSRFEGGGQFIGIVAMVVIVVLLVASRNVRSRWSALALGLVVGGAAGNLVDRLVQPGPGLLGGRVTDFIDLQWFPVFNLADSAITVGGILVVLIGLSAGTPSGDGQGTTVPNEH